MPELAGKTCLEAEGMIKEHFGTHEIKTGKPHYDRFGEIPEEHPHETDRFKISYWTYNLLIIGDGNLKLIPFNF